MDGVAAPALRRYLAVLGATLLAQGLASWTLDASGTASDRLPYRFANADPRHALIHVAWGALILVLLVRGLDARGAVRLTLAFGVFYSGLAVLGLVVHHPFGLRLDRGENVFHLLVGPVTLALAGAATRLERVPA
jgi:hypothetical protein